MLTLIQTLTFLATAMMLTLTPGPDNLMVLGIALSRGKRQGMIFGLGCALGCLSHTLMAIVGISAFILTSPKAFLALKIAGGTYLIYLGAQILLNKKSNQVDVPQTLDHPTDSAVFTKGLLASSINPKVTLFFISFLPQFVIPQQGNITFQFGFLSLIFIFQAMVIFCSIGYFSGSIGNLLKRNLTMISWLDSISGSIFILLGMRIWVSS